MHLIPHVILDVPFRHWGCLECYHERRAEMDRQQAESLARITAAQMQKARREEEIRRVAGRGYFPINYHDMTIGDVPVERDLAALRFEDAMRSCEPLFPAAVPTHAVPNIVS